MNPVRGLKAAGFHSHPPSSPGAITNSMSSVPGGVYWGLSGNPLSLVVSVVLPVQVCRRAGQEAGRAEPHGEDPQEEPGDPETHGMRCELLSFHGLSPLQRARSERPAGAGSADAGVRDRESSSSMRNDPSPAG